MSSPLLSLVLEATEHAHRLEIIIEQKAEAAAVAAASEAKALANAVTPELEGAITALTDKLKAVRAAHEAAADSSVAHASDTAPVL